MKKITLMIVMLLMATFGLQAQNSNVGKSAADKAWEDLVKTDIDTNDSQLTSGIKSEMHSRKFIESGIRFWHQFPDDERRLAWFSMASSFEPGFWKNIEEGVKMKYSSEPMSTPIDWELFNKWEKERLKIEKEIQGDPDIPEDKKRGFRNALSREMSRSKNAEYRGDKDKFIERVKAAFGDPRAYYNAEKNTFTVNRMIEQFFFNFDKFGLQMEDLIAFAKHFTNSKYPEMKEWAQKKMNVYALVKEPFKFRYHDINGNEIDMEKLLGKVVLVDFWSNTCSSCIARMPAIKKVYDKYKNDGFVVLSAARNPEMDKELILTIHEKIGADWPVILLGGNSKESGVVTPDSPAKKLFDKYGFNYVPQLFLLDKEGKLVMYNGLLMSGDFEPLVKKLLANK